jgi:hypothetical protein
METITMMSAVTRILQFEINNRLKSKLESGVDHDKMQHGIIPSLSGMHPTLKQV